MLYRSGEHGLVNLRRIPTLLIVVLFICINAALAENAVFTSSINTLSSSYSECTPGNDYSLIVISGSDSQGNFNSNNLLFINQVTANSNGDTIHETNRSLIVQEAK